MKKMKKLSRNKRSSPNMNPNTRSPSMNRITLLDRRDPPTKREDPLTKRLTKRERTEEASQSRGNLAPAEDHLLLGTHPVPNSE